MRKEFREEKKKEKIKGQKLPSMCFADKYFCVQTTFVC